MDNRTANGSDNGKEEGDNNAGHWAGNDTQPLVSLEGNINGVRGIGEVLITNNKTVRLGLVLGLVLLGLGLGKVSWG